MLGGASEVNSPFIIAELSGNHLGSQERAIQLIDTAVRCGADAVKFQCFTPEQMADPGVVVQSGTWAGCELLQLYRETHTPKAWFPLLFAHARASHIVPFASVFHPDDVDFLETLGCEMYKISSFEILDLPLIRYTASKGKPLVLSTGMASEEEIEAAWYSTSGSYPVTVMKCTSGYPADPAEANLLTMRAWLRPQYAYDVGLSDHTLGLGVAVAAVALGATMIEKHLTFSRADGGQDAAFSSEPAEFAAMVTACREAAAALGEVRYGPTESEMSSLPLRRKPGGKRGG
jgi:N-acetylneuraminate synthase